jgi:hypothetical protein
MGRSLIPERVDPMLSHQQAEMQAGKPGAEDSDFLDIDRPFFIVIERHEIKRVGRALSGTGR